MISWWLGTGAAVVVGGLTWASVSPRNSLWGKVIWHGPRGDSQRVALTFDDGPTAPYTGQVLDELAALHVPATFFAIGRNIARDGELIDRAHAAGHLIGNHTQDHAHLGIMRRGGLLETATDRHGRRHRASDRPASRAVSAADGRAHLARHAGGEVDGACDGDVDAARPRWRVDHAGADCRPTHQAHRRR